MAAEYSVEEVTTTVVRYRIKTPANWNDVDQMRHHARMVLNKHEGRAHNATPFDDEMWYEPGDEDIAVCFKKVTRAGGESDVQ